MIEHKRIFINGQWVESEAVESIAVVNPATEDIVAWVPSGGENDVHRAAQAASAAFDSWSRSPIAERVEIFRKMARLTEARADEITRSIVTELGYPITWAAKSQTAGAVEELEIIAKTLQQIAWTEQVGNTQVSREPSGVVAAITAWNAPLRSVISKAGAAIAAGCTVVLKPSEVAPLTAFIFAEITAQAGLPPGVFNLVCGTGPRVGEAMARHPGVDMVSLTGSVRAGRRVMEVAAGTIKRVHLELGGKSANLLCEDADFERAVRDGIEDALRNSGQVCGGLTRMLVPRRRLAEAEEIAVARAEQFALGDPFSVSTTLGPVSTAAARERIRGYIRSGLEEGGHMLTGGPDAPAGLDKGWFVRPTLFTGHNAMRIAQEEIFGPVVVVIPYDSESEAIALALSLIHI